MPTENKEPQKMGLREKKIKKTRATLQREGMRLFREQGYHATTIEQIAEASEISLSTFYRYFPTKEALVLDDEYDPMLKLEFQKQSPNLNPIQAFRATLLSGFAKIAEDDRLGLQERMRLTQSVPELRAASLLQLNDTLLLFADLVAERLGRSRDDFKILTLAGSILGVSMAVQIHMATHPEVDFVTAIDEAMSHLEAGMAHILDV